MSYFDELDKLRARLIGAANANDLQAMEIHLAAIRAFYAAHPAVIEQLDNERLARVRG